VTACVLDASFTFQWLFQDEASPEGYAALAVIGREGAVVPPLWFVEITNGLGMAERRGRIAEAKLPEALSLLRSLPLTVSEAPSLTWCEPILELMRAYRLTAYDATYLELARGRRLPLATGDRDLIGAAPAVGVPLFAAAP
jgi:predicted nucleic acid-binding protein